jgi:hypothetical protein
MFIGTVDCYGEPSDHPAQKLMTNNRNRNQTLSSSIRCAVKKPIWNSNYLDKGPLLRVICLRHQEISPLWGASTAAL